MGLHPCGRARGLSESQGRSLAERQAVKDVRPLSAGWVASLCLPSEA